jgi:hypothetical protein
MNVKKMIYLSKFFASGGEIREWKTGLTLKVLHHRIDGYTQYKERKIASDLYQINKA